MASETRVASVEGSFGQELRREREVRNVTLAEISGATNIGVRFLEALENDHEFLLKGDVFSADLVEAYVDWKRTEELTPSRAVPTPWEFFMYYDV